MISIKRMFLQFLLIFVFFGIIAVRLFFIQVWHHGELSRKVNRIVFRKRPELPCRGMILDRTGRILAMSIKTHTLFVDPKMVKDVQELAERFKHAGISISKDVIESSKDKSYLPIKRNVDDETVSLIKSWKLPGVGFIPDYQRKYPEGEIACHLLGVEGRDGHGLEGIEFSANGYLSGEKVKGLHYRDGTGREIPEKLLDSEKIQGANVYLTIDRNLQFIVEQEIDKAWRKSKSKKAMALIQDPNTGEILALACRPNYNPGDFSGSWQNLRNPAISDIFEPGSTFKLVTAASALEEKKAKRTEVIWCEKGKYQIYDHTIRDHEKKGLLTFDQIIEYSSNIGTAKIGERLGKQTLYKYIRQFGFYSKTGINLPGEARGLLKLPKKWSGLSLPTISFGQGIGVTALQIINAYSSIANGGLLLKPRIIKEVKSRDGKILYSSEEKVIRRTVSSEVAEDIKEILFGAVERGTGMHAKIVGYSIGGKTGTAQKRDEKTKKYSSTAYVASFCGILPVSDPKLAILIILDEPEGDYWASTRAVPVFQKVAMRAISYLRIPPEEKPFYLAGRKE